MTSSSDANIQKKNVIVCAVEPISSPVQRCVDYSAKICAEERIRTIIAEKAEVEVHVGQSRQD